ncbi:MAG: hypothetical protein J6M39_07055 [Lachnospiraceae bacterium]|nr:hypothetical protein [Lachnospiraceae bacterium]
MQYNRVMSLSNGTCIKIDNSLTYRVKSITFELEKNKKYEDHINISNVRELNMDGNAYSDNNRVLIKNPIINDKAYNISFTIDTVDLEDGDIVSGNISIITNVGNANIPFEYKIITDNLTRAVNNLDTITDYYDYFVSDFEGGRTLFIEKRILKAHFMQDDFIMSLYEGLIKGSNKDIAIIEFFRAFEIDVTNLYKNVNDEIVRRYIDDTLDNIDLETIKASDDLNKLLTINSKESKEELIKNEILLEASNIIDNLKDKELLIVLASMCVRSNFTDQLSFKIYLKVIEKGSNIHGIYDKFLLSIPDDYANKLPLYIYRYYFEDKSYTFDDKAKLYENIIAVFGENEDVYMMFNNEMLEYAISRIYQNRITESLIKIYNKLLNINIINENNCNNILYLLRSHKFIIANTNIKKVIIKYAETEKETKYDVVNGIAYVPIFFDSRVILYEDIYGNRFYNEDVNISILFEKKELESYIVENYPPSEIIDMTKVIKLNEAQTLTREYEVEEIRELENKLNLNIVIKKKNKNKIIDYYYREVLAGNTISDNAKTFLMKLVFGKMNTDDKRKILKIMIECKEYIYVFGKASYYGLNLLDDSDLLVLFLKCIDINDETNKARLINDIFSFVKKGNRDIKLLNYLSNNYESSIENMVFVMDKMVECGLDSSYMAKKILMLVLESNDVSGIDHIFDNYDETIDENDSLVVAYLNKKATDYFLDDIETSDEYFSKLTKYLSNHYDEIDTLPIIFLFAITKYISTFRMLSDNDLRRILIKSMERLLKTDYVFAYYKKLNKHVRIPYSIMNKEYIEYHADKDFVPRAIITISGEDDKKTIELTKVFMNIYVKKITVFKNEIINYEIINSSDASNVLAKGTLTYDENYELEYPKYNKMRGTFDYINDAIVCLDRDNIEGLKKVVLEMIEKQEMSKALFNLWS